MTDFKDFKIKSTIINFVGDKIQIFKVLNKEIMVHYFKIAESKIYKNREKAQCMTLQISIGDENRIIFTSASKLIEMIQLVPENGFPFKTVIIEKNKMYEFS